MQKNQLFWAYNLPLQVWPSIEANPEAGEDERESILNYMPRRARCETLFLDEVLGDQTREEFFEEAARRLENLARLMREAAKDPSKHVYYPDEGLGE